MAECVFLVRSPKHRKNIAFTAFVFIAIHLSSAPIAVLRVLHLTWLLVPFVLRRLHCGVRLATHTILLPNVFAKVVRQLLYLAPIATFHMSPRRGGTANIHLALGKCTFALFVSIAMVPLLYAV